MNSLNKVQLIGNMTRDPELKQTPNGTAVVSFSIATNRVWKDQNGEKQEQVEFHNIVAWARLAEIISEYCHKGKKVYVEGYLQTRNWEDKDTGKKMYRTEINAQNVILLSPKGDGGTDYQHQEPPEVQAAQKQNQTDAQQDAQYGNDEIKPEDLPF